MSTFNKNPIELGAVKISIDDNFQFGCIGCGNCCRGRYTEISNTNIFLSAPDVKRISQYLNIPLNEVIEKYVVLYNDHKFGLTTCMLRFKSGGCCVFLKKGTCSIYDVRPRTCALYPLGRSINIIEKKRKLEYLESQYVINEEELFYKCTKENTYTIREWLEKNNVPLCDEEEINWVIKLIETSMKIKNSKRGTDFTEKTFKILYDIET